MAGFEVPTLEYPAIRELSEIPQWVCWKYIFKPGQPQPTKVPIDPNTLRTAAVNRPETWGTFARCAELCVKRDDLDGIGFVITRETPYTCVDLDGCISKNGYMLTGSPAEDIVKRLDSYTELSPSNTGLHIWVRSKPPGRSRKCSLGEIYEDARFICMTGKHWSPSPETIEKRDIQLARVYYELFPSAGKAQNDIAPALATSNTVIGNLMRDLTPFCVADAVAPPDKLALLLENADLRFKRTWQHEERKGENDAPWSISEYDMSLANTFAAAGWTPIEAMQAMIEFRRKYGIQDKLRPDYYARTLERVYKDYGIANGIHMPTKTRGLTPEERAAHMTKLRALLDIPFTKFVKYTAEPPRYRIETELNNAEGDVDMIASQTKFRDKMIECSNTLLPVFKAGKWREISAMLIGAMEDEETGAEGSDQGQVLAWIESYLDERPKAADHFDEEAVIAGNPFRRADGALYIVMGDLGKYLRRNLGQNIPVKKLGVMLRSAGCLPGPVNVFVNGEQTSRTAWRLPDRYRRKA